MILQRAADAAMWTSQEPSGLGQKNKKKLWPPLVFTLLIPIDGSVRMAQNKMRHIKRGISKKSKKSKISDRV